MSNQGIIKDITLNLDINARKRVEGKVDIKLYSKDIATGQFEFTFIDEDGETVVLDETYSAQALVKYEDEEKTYLDDMTIEGNIIRFIFPHDFITKDGIVTMYIYITKDNYTSDVAAISFNVYRSEIDDVATDIVAAYDKNYEDILAEFKQTLEDYKSTLPKADSVRAEIDEVLNKFSEDGQAKLSQYDTDVQQVITDINEAETSRVEAEGQRESAETSRKANEADRDQAESERQTNETKRQTIFETNESERDGTFSTNETVRQENETTRQQAETQRASAESSRASAEAQRKTDHANRSTEFAGKADKIVLKNLIENGDFRNSLSGWTGLYSSISLDLENSMLKATYISVANNTYITAPPHTYIADDVYYARTTFIPQMDIDDIRHYYNGVYHQPYLLNPTPNTETILSNTFKGVSGGSTTNQIRLLDGDPNVGDSILIKDSMLMNLTDIFGAGNEPTKEEMDELVNAIGYIEGEYGLNNKEMFGYLMRGISEKANKKQEDWITPTLLNGATGTLQYRKNNLGRVEFKGNVKQVNAGISSFISLPRGYGMPSHGRLPVLSYDNTLGSVSAIKGDNYRTLFLSSSLGDKEVSLNTITFEGV